MSQPYTLAAKKGMDVVTDWKEMHSEAVKFQFLQVVKIQLCKNFSNLVCAGPALSRELSG